MSVTSNDVIDQEAVRAEVEEYAEKNRVWRQAFRQIDSTDIDSNTVEIPVLDEERAAGVVDEGTSYPSAGDATRKVDVEHNKYGVEVELTYEAIQDALLDVIALHTEERAEDLADALDEAAYAEVEGNLQADVIGDAGGELGYTDVIDAMTALEGESFEPDLLIVSPESKGDLMKSDEFTRASELGDDIVRDGAFGEVAGVPVFVDDGGHIGAGEAVMFDSGRYGIESEREAMTSQEYEEESENKRVVQVRTRMGWKAVRPEAGVKIEG
ncbi:phage major capsid protein [Natronolimnobius sp. AArcel1]|uniref:phage major capsid protein n=1 Tax=Natronolimnobius sp. AArcel1 TaxID=1679093 RepID=UPI0013EC76F5|nr:phage major capsid protein [Natronolimnobius sp. AArcel1]NGM69189.1 phage major capsid protein [Natronolimnobius sp. AArcel1]